MASGGGLTDLILRCLVFWFGFRCSSFEEGISMAFVSSENLQKWQRSAQGQKFREPHKYGKTIHLFIRPKKDENNITVPFHYCGVPRFVDWEGEQPITVKWELSEAVPEYLRARLKVPD